MRVARTVADLEGAAAIVPAHVAAGVRYRLLSLSRSTRETPRV